ncbi:MAG: hypothetical protein R8M14_02305 [Ghiorsea sp.]
MSDLLKNFDASKPIHSKRYSICGIDFPTSEYKYGNRKYRSYCNECNKEEKAAYSQGGTVAAEAYREKMRAKWQSS